MGKSYSTYYLSEAMVCVGPVVNKRKLSPTYETEPLSLYRPIKSETYSSPIRVRMGALDIQV